MRTKCGSSAESVLQWEASTASRVYGYGGGSYCLVPGDAWTSRPCKIAYVSSVDQCVILVDPSRSSEVRLTKNDRSKEIRCYGDLVSTADGRWIVTICESTGTSDGISSRSIVAFDATRPGRSVELFRSPGFLSSPRPSKDGRSIVWITWRQSDMSWVSSELWLASLHEKDGELELVDQRRIDGGNGVSVGQPMWHSDGSIIYVCDTAGWWQPWKWDDTVGMPEQLSDEHAEFHAPDWTLGQKTMDELSPSNLVCKLRRGARDQLALLDTGSGVLSLLDQPCVSISSVCSHDDTVAWLGSTPDQLISPWYLKPGGRRRGQSPKSNVDEPALVASLCCSKPALPDWDVSRGQEFSFMMDSNRLVTGLFYRASSEQRFSRTDSLSPLVVFCHGGPTGAVEAGLDLTIQFFTSRGFAVAAVDYGGSSGYGREYRALIERRWGIVDVQDCIGAARHLGDEGVVDPDRIAIRGTSAGGFTALNALVLSDVFKGAVSWYGVTDLIALNTSTHDFESHYNDWLVGPLCAFRDEYYLRSPINRASQIKGSVLLIQGAKDPVVPPEQAREMAERLAECDVDCQYLEFEEESHGFHKPGSIAAALRAELAFYERVLDDRSK